MLIVYSKLCIPKAVFIETDTIDLLRKECNCMKRFTGNTLTTRRINTDQQVANKEKTYALAKCFYARDDGLIFNYSCT